ncbi:MAG: Efflux transporter, family, subunit [Chthoniobacteraceae bacterium]|nr:Efflux transporter, family, subunit [Chthoniobacteraceae bacterium]
MQSPTYLVNAYKKLSRRQRIGGGIAAAALLFWLVRGGSDAASNGSTFTARCGPLDITVLEGGSVQALESQEVKCEVRANNGTKILKIVEEGSQVTPEDIAANKVLVELDSSELQKQIVQQDSVYESARAGLVDAQENYGIQINQNLSDIKAAEQKGRFMRMDFDKFLGATVTQEIIDGLGMEKEMAAAKSQATDQTNAVLASVDMSPPKKEPAAAAPGAPGVEVKPDTVPAAAAPTDKPAELAVSITTAPPVPGATAPTAQVAVDPAPLAPPEPPVVFDFSKYANMDLLGDGEAKQKLRKFQDELLVAQKELGQAKANLEGTNRLFEKGFVTKTDLSRDEIAHENSRLKVQTAQTASNLFLQYDFRKSAEEALSKYVEAIRDIVKARSLAIAKLAQSEAKLRSAQSQYNIQSRLRTDLYDQLEKCVIVAKKPGLVVYGGAREDGFMMYGQEQIREGATVRERQSIITIPDMTTMSVRVKIHESYIKKIKKGQKAKVTVDAFADKRLEGEVTKVGVIPDSQNRYLSPDLKVYLTTLTIKGTQDWLKPGMSAKVEIIANQLSNVVYVPVQAISPFDGKQVCYVARRGGPERREVTIGEFNDEFIEIKAGLKEGERVLLRAAPASTPGEESDKKPEPEKPAAAAPAVAASA